MERCNGLLEVPETTTISEITTAETKYIFFCILQTSHRVVRALDYETSGRVKFLCGEHKYL